MNAPRDDLVRMSRDASVSDDGRTLYGTPIVFNTWTEIDSYEGRFLERIAPTALTKTLQQRGDRVTVLFNHGMDPQIGDKPLGKPTVMDVRSDGLHVEVPLSRTSYNEDLAALIGDGALQGMSFRFGVTDDTWEEPKRSGDLPKRTITALKLHEFGPVTFPAYEATTVGIRSAQDFAEWRALDDQTRTRVKAVVQRAADDPDEDPVDLVEAVDAALDAAQSALDDGNVAQAEALLTAAETAVDALLMLLGGTDADESDEMGAPMMGGMYSAELTDLNTRTATVREGIATAHRTEGPRQGTPRIQREISAFVLTRL